MKTILRNTPNLGILFFCLICFSQCNGQKENVYGVPIPDFKDPKVTDLILEQDSLTRVLHQYIEKGERSPIRLNGRLARFHDEIFVELDRVGDEKEIDKYGKYNLDTARKSSKYYEKIEQRIKEETQAQGLPENSPGLDAAFFASLSEENWQKIIRQITFIPAVMPSGIYTFSNRRKYSTEHVHQITDPVVKVKEIKGYLSKKVPRWSFADLQKKENQEEVTEYEYNEENQLLQKTVFKTNRTSDKEPDNYYTHALESFEYEDGHFKKWKHILGSTTFEHRKDTLYVIHANQSTDKDQINIEVPSQNGMSVFKKQSDHSYLLHNQFTYYAKNQLTSARYLSSIYNQEYTFQYNDNGQLISWVSKQFNSSSGKPEYFDNTLFESKYNNLGLKVEGTMHARKIATDEIKSSTVNSFLHQYGHDDQGRLMIKVTDRQKNKDGNYDTIYTYVFDEKMNWILKMVEDKNPRFLILKEVIGREIEYRN